MNCEHCLRGGPGTGDMNPEILRDFLKQVDEIDEITFTGGEPSLNIPIMREFYKICEEYQIPVKSFFVATNGKENQLELATFLLEQYDKAEYKDMCGVALSIDAFHDDDISHMVKGLAFYTTTKEHAPNDCDWPIPVGNALTWGLGGDNIRNINERFSFETPQQEENIQLNTAYLSLNGCVFPDCNLTIEEEDDAIKSPNDCPTEHIMAATALEQLKNLYAERNKSYGKN